MSLSAILVLDIGKEVTIIYLGILIGYLIGRSKYYSDSVAKKLSQLGVYVVFPPIIIANTLDVGEGQITEVVSVLGFSLLFHLFLLGISVLMLTSRTPLEKGSSVLTATFPNAVTYAFPIIAALLGLAGWIPATIFAMGSLLIMATVGGAVALRYSRTSEYPPSFRENLMKLLKFPFFIAIFVAIVLRGTIGHIETNQFLPVLAWKYLGVGIGLTLIGLDCRALTKSSILKSGLNRSIVIRFVLSPVIAIGVCIVFRFPRLIAIPLIVQAWGPPAIMTILYSEFFGLDTQRTSRDVTLLTFLALLLLPLEIFIILWLYPA